MWTHIQKKLPLPVKFLFYFIIIYDLGLYILVGLVLIKVFGLEFISFWVINQIQVGLGCNETVSGMSV